MQDLSIDALPQSASDLQTQSQGAIKPFEALETDGFYCKKCRILQIGVCLNNLRDELKMSEKTF